MGGNKISQVGTPVVSSSGAPQVVPSPTASNSGTSPKADEYSAQRTRSLPQPQPVQPDPNRPTISLLSAQAPNRPVSGQSTGEVGEPLMLEEIDRLNAAQQRTTDSNVGARKVSQGETLAEAATRLDTTEAVLRELNPDLTQVLDRNGKFTENTLLAVPIGDLPKSKRPHTGRLSETGPNAYSTPAPGIHEILKGEAVMYRGMSGESVKELQKKLNAMGANLDVDGKFGPKTEAALKAFQAANGITQTGVLGQLSWEKLLSSEALKIPEGALGPSEVSAEELAKMANGHAGEVIAQRAAQVANDMRSTGACAKGVNDVLVQLGLESERGHAYQKAEQLANNRNFKEISLDSESLKNLPAGAVVVWGRSVAKPYGHVSIALGNGKEASDHVQRQIEAGRYGTDFGNGPDPMGRQFRVFLPSKSVTA